MDWPDSPDAAPLGDGRRALSVDRPRTAEELGECVARRGSEGVAVYPQGGRTALDYGGIPARPGVALDVSALNRVIDFPAADMTVTVEAGITLSDLQKTLGAEGQFLPIDAPYPERATIGGIYATNACGPRRFGWGRPRDHIIGIGFVTADGKAIKGGGRVVKNVAGYDFPKLMTGSMGTLGVITSLTLKVRPKPEASALVAIPFANPAELEAAVGMLNTSVTRPVAIEVLNPLAAKSYGETAPGQFLLVVGFEDNASSVAWQVNQLPIELGRSRSECSIVEGNASADSWKTLTDFGTADTGNSLTIWASVPRSKSLALGLTLAPDRWKVKVQAGSGTIQASASSDHADVARSDALAFRARVEELGGGMVLSSCPTAWKSELKVWGSPRGDWAVMERIKTALDPAGVLNPGRFVGRI